MKDQLILLLLFSVFFFGCEKIDPVNEHIDEVRIQVENQLTLPIDTFQFYFLTSIGQDSILISQLEEGQSSNFYYFDDIHYYFKDISDLFFISKGYFSIAGKKYYLSNCFCDPNLQDGIINEGKILIEISGIDEARGNVEYIVKRE